MSSFAKFIAFSKKNPVLIPLYVTVGGGAVMAGLYTLRLSLGETVVWDNGNPAPWQSVNYNTKMMNLQSKDPKEVFKAPSAEDLRGKI